MNNPLITSAYVFAGVFGSLCTIAFVLRFLAGRSPKSTSQKSREASRDFATEELRDIAPASPAMRSEDRLAPPPAPRDDLDYHHAADYVLDPRSSYPIPQPLRRNKGEW